MRILITGSRDWQDRDAIYNALFEAALHHHLGGGRTSDITVVHGGARGADSIAGQIARQYGMQVEVHSADWKTFGKAAGHRRNADMVALGADLALAFPLGESRGTRGCVALCEKAGIPVVIHEGAPA